MNKFGGQAGGVESYIAELVDSLRKIEHDSQLIYFDDLNGGDLIPNTIFVPLNYENASSIGIDEMERAIGNFKPDVVLIHAVYRPEVIAWITQRLPTVAYIHAPYVVCPGNAQYLRNSERVCSHSAGMICLANAQLERCCWGRDPLKHWSRLTRVRSFRKVYQQVSELIVGSQFMEELIVRGGFSSTKTNVLAPLLVEEPLPQFRFHEDSKIILFAGRLVPEKGLHHLLQALVTIDGEWRLQVAGEGPDRRNCEILTSKLGLEDKVTFLGWLDRKGISEALDACAFVALPSLWPEPFGRSGIEAFVRGRPVVAYDTGGVADWLEDEQTGFLVEPKDVTGLSRRIWSLLNNTEQRRKMSIAARSRVLVQWNATSHLAEMLTIIERAVRSF